MPSRLFAFQKPANPASIIACIDDSADAATIAAFAATISQAFDLPLTLLHIVEPINAPGRRTDPLEWNLHRQQARRLLARLSENLPLPPGKVRMEIAEGESVRSICERAHETGSIMVIGTPTIGDQPTSLGGIAHQVLDAAAGSILLVPTGCVKPTAPFNRIMVPLDGSSFAEAALVEAVQLARNSGAELLLTYVVPGAGLTLFGPPETPDVELRLRLERRNEQAACDFLEKTRRRLADQGIRVRAVCLKGDIRSTLKQAITDENPSLVVLSARGQGGRHCHDLSLGGTAAYLLAHLAGPTMLVQPSAMRTAQPVKPSIQTRRPTTAFAAR